MKGLKQTLASLSALRSRFERLLSSAGARRAASTPSAAQHLRRQDDFGSNPGNLRMLSYVPQDLPRGRPLVVALHGCTQTAAVFDYGSGWSNLAERHGFAMLFPEQQHANNPNNCFNWFLASDTRRGQGEALSIRQMIERMIEDYDIDRSRILRRRPFRGRGNDGGDARSLSRRVCRRSNHCRPAARGGNQRSRGLRGHGG